MRLGKIVAYLDQKGWKYTYWETDGLGQVDFEARGLRYHVWEFLDVEPGAESNVRSTGRMEDYTGEYEETILAILQGWQG